MNATERKEEEENYEVGDRFSLPLERTSLDEEYPNNNSEYSNNNSAYTGSNSEYPNNNSAYTGSNNEYSNNNAAYTPNTLTESETVGSEAALLGEDVQRYTDDEAFIQDTLMPIMRSYFPTDPSENGEKNILAGVLKHDAIVIVKVKQLMEEGTDNNEDFVERIEEYTDDEYMDKETIEDTLELTLKYVTGIKSSIDTYVEYDFFCSSIPGYKQFVEEMLQYRVVMRLNRHMFYKELYGYLQKEVFDNYDFNTAIFDFDSEVNEFVKENKRQGRNKKVNTKKPFSSPMAVPLTANNYEEATPTGIINANKINTSRVGSSIFGTANATANGTAPASNGTAPASNGTASTSNGTASTSNGTASTSNGTASGTASTSNGTASTSNGTASATAPTLMNQLTSAVTGTATAPATATATAPATAKSQPTLLNQLATATGFKKNATPQKGGRVTPRQGHSSSRFTRRH